MVGTIDFRPVARGLLAREVIYPPSTRLPTHELAVAYFGIAGAAPIHLTELSNRAPGSSVTQIEAMIFTSLLIMRWAARTPLEKQVVAFLTAGSHEWGDQAPGDIGERWSRWCRDQGCGISLPRGPVGVEEIAVRRIHRPRA